MLKLTGKKVKLKMCRYMRGLKFQQQQHHQDNHQEEEEKEEEEEEEEGVYRLTAVYDRGVVMTQDMGAHCNMSSDTDDTLSCSHTQEDEMVEMKELIFNKETILVSAVGSPERKNILSSETKLFCYEMNNILVREKYFVANDDRNTAW